MTNEEKRQLLAEVLSGNFARLRVYRVNNQYQDTSIRWVIDGRECGRPIEVIFLDYTRKEVTVEEFEAFPAKNRIWTIQDHTGSKEVPAPDEDYHNFGE